MPNRLIRDEMLESESILNLPVEARWFYVTILLSADDVGLFEAKSFKLARRADIRRESGESFLQMLADVDLIRLYNVDQKRYGFIPRFRQRLQIKRSKYPSPPLSLIQDDLDATNKINDLASKTTVVKQLTSDAKQLSTVVKQSEPEPEPEPETKREKKARGTRLTQDFVLPEDFLEYCSIKHPHLNPHAVFEEFKDYYLSKGEVKADWGATWRNWLRKEGTFKNSSTTAKPSSKPNLIAGAI
jgi:hypothetical protein